MRIKGRRQKAGGRRQEVDKEINPIFRTLHPTPKP